MSTIRLYKDIGEIKKMKNVKVSFPSEGNLSIFIVSIKVSEGYWKGKWFRFKFEIPAGWPADQPNVTILDDIWHPNIRLLKNGGTICVSTLRKDYRPTYVLSSIVVSLQYLFQNPNPNDSYNIEAGHELLSNKDLFEAHVSQYMDRMPSDDDDE